MIKTYKAGLLTILSILILTVAGSGATLSVINTNDSGAGSLRAQVAAAASGDTIDFAGIPSNSTITLTTGQITFPAGRNLTIDASAKNTITVVATPGSRVFRMPNDGTRNITLINLVITGGSLSANASLGAGISFESGGAFVLTRCSIVGNTITGTNSFGAGLYMANSGGTLTITGSTISGNSITASNGQGGGLWMGSNTTMVNSTVSGNALTPITATVRAFLSIRRCRPSHSTTLRSHSTRRRATAAMMAAVYSARRSRRVRCAIR